MVIVTFLRHDNSLLLMSRLLITLQDIFLELPLGFHFKCQRQFTPSECRMLPSQANEAKPKF